MSKLLTGALAGALLLDEERTVTLWNSKASVSGGNIVAGDLPVATVGVGMAWMTGAPAVAANSAPARNLPGNAVLGVTGSSISGSSIASNSVTGSSIAGFSIANTSVTGTLITGAAPTCAVISGTEAISSSPVVVTATITLPKSLTADCENSVTHGLVNLTNLMVTPTQD